MIFTLANQQSQKPSRESLRKVLTHQSNAQFLAAAKPNSPPNPRASPESSPLILTHQSNTQASDTVEASQKTSAESLQDPIEKDNTQSSSTAQPATQPPQKTSTESLQDQTSQNETQPFDPVCWESPYVHCGENPVGYSINRRYTKEFGDFQIVKIDPEFGKLSEGLHAFRLEGRDNTTLSITKENTFKIALLFPVGHIASLDFSECKHKNCEYAGQNVDETVDLVVVNGVNIRTGSVPKRWDHQLYAMFSAEPPTSWNCNLLRSKIR